MNARAIASAPDDTTPTHPPLIWRHGPQNAPGLVADDDDLCMGRDLPAEARPVAFVERNRWQCGWPIEPLETPGHARMLCCGAPALERSPYCARHAARARREPPAAPAGPPSEATITRRFAA